MKKYITEHDAVVDLHERGYSLDFQLCGNDLLLSQEQVFVRAGEFSISEFYWFSRNGDSKPGVLICGIHVFTGNLKGILIHHCTNRISQTPPVLIKKINELLSHSEINTEKQEYKTSVLSVRVIERLREITLLKAFKQWGSKSFENNYN